MTVHVFVSAEKPNKADLELLFNHLNLIVKYKKQVLGNPDFYNIHIQGTGAFLLYAMPFRLFLGDMLTLWDKGGWKENEDYFYCITGSPLSGSNSSSYWSETAGFSYKSNAGKNFMDMFRTASSLLNTGKIERTESISGTVPTRTASKMTIADLISVLKSKEVDNLDENSIVEKKESRDKNV